MGRGKHCSPEKRGQIKKKLSSEAKSYSEIRKLLDCFNKMITNALRYEPKVVSRGRKRIWSPLMLKRLVRTTKSNSFMSAMALRKELDLPACEKTIRCRLRGDNLNACSSARTQSM